LCKKNDVKSFAKGINYLTLICQKDNEQRLKNARAFVQERYSKDRMLKDMAALYKEILN